MKIDKFEIIINDIISPLLEEKEYSLYDIRIIQLSGKYRIMIFIKGINIGDCVKFSNIVNNALQIEDEFNDIDYTLEISSPGLTRKLKCVKHYKNSIGDNVKIVLKKKDEEFDTNVLHGRILSVNDKTQDIVIDINGIEMMLNFDRIKKGRIEQKNLFKGGATDDR